MAISLQSSSPNEILLCDALKEQEISFQEQYPIYEGGKFSQPKYFVDFLITHKDKKIIVECDGYTYHSSDSDVDNDLERDRWIKRKTGLKILRFTSHQLKTEMPIVIDIIKNELGIVEKAKKQLKFKGRKIRSAYISNVENENLHEVSLYYTHIQFQDKVWITYKFEDVTLGKFSDMRMRAFSNVPNNVGADLSLLVALLDLKYNTKLLLHCQSEWLTSYLNKEKLFKAKYGLLKKLDEVLANHNYLAKYIVARHDITHFSSPKKEIMILQELRSKCKQIRYDRLESFTEDSYEDFSSFIVKHNIIWNNSDNIFD